MSEAYLSKQSGIDVARRGWVVATPALREQAIYRTEREVADPWEVWGLNVKLADEAGGHARLGRMILRREAERRLEMLRRLA